MPVRCNQSQMDFVRPLTSPLGDKPLDRVSKAKGRRTLQHSLRTTHTYINSCDQRAGCHIALFYYVYYLGAQSAARCD